MNTKIVKGSILVLAVLCSLNYSYAAPIVELASPRSEAPKVISDDGSTMKPKTTVDPKTANKKEKKQIIKKHKKIVHKKPRPIVINYDKVSELIEYGYYDDADKILEGAINRNAKDIKAKSLYMVSLAKQCKLDPAQDSLDILLKAYPKDSNLHYAQGIVYFKRTSSSNMFYRNNSQQLLSNSLKEFKKAIDLDKNNEKAYNAAGVVSLKLGNKKDALDYFNKAVSIDKNYSMALDNLGTLDLASGKVADAEKKFKSALKANTQNTTAMYHLAQVAIQKSDYVTALSYLNDALAINDNSPAIYNLMGKCYLAQKNEAAAINSFKKSLSVKPEFTMSYIDLANVYEKRGDAEFAVEQLKTAVSVDPNCYDAKLKIGDISLANGKYTQAINIYAELVGKDNYNEKALVGLANAYYGQAQIAANKAMFGSNRDLFKAMDYINKAIEANDNANSNNLELHLAKLRLAKITNQPDLSKSELNKIILSPSTDLMSSVIKGEAYIALNDYKNAEMSFNAAASLSKNTDDDLYLSEIFMYHKFNAPAEQIIHKILQADPQNKEALNNLDYIKKSKKYAENYYNSAVCFVKAKNYAAASEYLSRSLAIDPGNAKAHLLLAQVCERNKDYRNALSNYQAYLSLEPNSSYSKSVQSKINKLDNNI